MRVWLRHFAVLLLTLLAAGAACRRPTPEVAVVHAPLPPLEVTREGSWLFTAVGDDGAFSTVDKVDDIPAASRSVVRVTNPAIAAQDRRDTTDVYVIDANRLLADGKVQARVLSRNAFESSALRQLPPGLTSVRGTGAQAAEAPAEDPAGSNLKPGQNPVVVVYGASWCGACRQAKAYLASHQIPFVEKDIERDPGAARELEKKASPLGIPTDRIPILDVRGRLLVGFDPTRLQTLLGQAI